MEKKDKISTRELVNRIKAQRKKPISPEFIERFNRITDLDEKKNPEKHIEEEKSKKKIARLPEAPL